MTGYNTVLQIRRFEERIAKLGMRMGYAKYSSSSNEFGSTISLMPLNNAYPIYSRDVELFAGTIEEAAEWLSGIEWAKDYYQRLGLVSDKKISAKEDLERQRQLIAKLKEEPGQVKHE